MPLLAPFEVCFKIDKWLLSKQNVVDFGILTNVQRLTVPRIIDQCCQKKRKNVDYKLMQEFIKWYFVVREQSAIENPFSAWYNPDGKFG